MPVRGLFQRHKLTQTAQFGTVFTAPFKFSLKRLNSLPQQKILFFYVDKSEICLFYVVELVFNPENRTKNSSNKGKAALL